MLPCFNTLPVSRIRIFQKVQVNEFINFTYCFEQFKKMLARKAIKRCSPLLVSRPRSSLQVSAEHVDESVLGFVRVGAAKGTHSHVGSQVSHVSSQGSISLKIYATFFPLRVSLKKLLKCESQGRLCKYYRQIHVILSF